MRSKNGGISKYEADILGFLHGKPAHFNIDRLETRSHKTHPVIFGEAVFEWSDKGAKSLSLRGDIGIYSPNREGEWRTLQIRETVSFIVHDITRNGEEFGIIGSDFRTKKKKMLPYSQIVGEINSGLGEVDRHFLAAVRYKKHHHKTITDAEVERMRQIRQDQIVALREETARILAFTKPDAISLF